MNFGACTKVLLIFFITAVNNKVASGMCSYYNNQWECDVPLKNVTSLFVKDTPNSKITVLNRKILEPFGELRYIYVGRAHVETLAPDTFEGHPLKAIYLNNNNIKKIEKGTLNSLNSTTSFEMTFNQLEMLENDTFLGMSSLDWMSLSANKIAKIEAGAFNGLVSLAALFLASNRITALDADTFKPLQKLSILDVSYNELTRLPVGLFSRLPNVQTLSLNHNEIEDLPDGIFDKLTALDVLDVSQNKLSRIQDTLFGKVLENFKEFKIYSNMITRFNATNFFTRAPKIKVIDLYDNPWDCGELERLKGDFLNKKVITRIPVRIAQKRQVDGIACV